MALQDVEDAEPRWLITRRKYCEMSSFKEVLPDIDQCLAIPAADLAACILPFIVNRTRRSMKAPEYLEANLQDYTLNEKQRLKPALLQAWQWLENNGFIGIDPEQKSDDSWKAITPKALYVRTYDDAISYVRDGLLNMDHITYALGDETLEKLADIVCGDGDLRIHRYATEIREILRRANLSDSPYPGDEALPNGCSTY